MPTLPPKACSHPMCPEHQAPDGRGMCTAHIKPRPKPSLAKRTSDSFYNKTRWRNARRRVLLTEPLCRICMESHRATEAKIVDHIIRRSHEGAEYDPNNLMPLCKSCHDRKTRDEQSLYDDGTYLTEKNTYIRFIPQS